MKVSDCIEWYPEEFNDCEVIYEYGWSDYEESWNIIVFRFFDELYAQEWGYCVLAEDNRPYFYPYLISEEQLEYMKSQH